jgi:hypothetical protein
MATGSIKISNLPDLTPVPFNTDLVGVDCNTSITHKVSLSEVRNTLKQTFVQNAQTASMLQPYVLTAQTASMLQPYVLTANTASMLQPYVLTAQTSSMLQPYVLTANTASMLQPYVLTAQTASMLEPYVLTAQTASMLEPYVLTADTASMLQPYVLNSQTESFATTGSNTFIGNQIISGSIEFGDGSLIQSVSASSGDGYGLTTMLLKPNTTYASDQYIILDPTAPNHIHIRAGGTIDNSNAELYLGGETGNVKIGSGINPNVYIASSGSNWAFENSGILKLNNGLGEIYADNNDLSVRIGNAPQNVAPNAQIILGGPTEVFKVKFGPPLREWSFMGNGDFNLTGSINGATNLVTNSQTGSMLSPYLLSSETGSFVTNSQTSSFVTNGQTSSFVTNSQTGSMLSPYLLSSQTGSFVTNTQTGSFVKSTSATSIEVMTSASYAAITPVSGTIYIIQG